MPLQQTKLENQEGIYLKRYCQALYTRSVHPMKTDWRLKSDGLMCLHTISSKSDRVQRGDVKHNDVLKKMKFNVSKHASTWFWACVGFKQMLLRTNHRFWPIGHQSDFKASFKTLVWRTKVWWAVHTVGMDWWNWTSVRFHQFGLIVCTGP